MGIGAGPPEFSNISHFVGSTGAGFIEHAPLKGDP
jgi:hypothetical protein